MPQNIVDSCVNSGLVSVPDDSGMLHEVEIVFNQKTNNRDYVDRSKRCSKPFSSTCAARTTPTRKLTLVRNAPSKTASARRGHAASSPQRNRRSKPTPCASPRSTGQDASPRSAAYKAAYGERLDPSKQMQSRIRQTNSGVGFRGGGGEMKYLTEDKKWVSESR